MIPLLNFLQFVVSGLIWVVVLMVIISAVISWLVAFDVINMRNRNAYAVVRALDRMTEPLLRPLRRFIPPLGGMDFTPVILILVLQGANVYLIPALFNWLRGFFLPAAF